MLSTIYHDWNEDSILKFTRTVILIIYKVKLLICHTVLAPIEGTNISRWEHPSSAIQGAFPPVLVVFADHWNPLFGEYHFFRSFDGEIVLIFLYHVSKIWLCFKNSQISGLSLYFSLGFLLATDLNLYSYKVYLVDRA